MWTNILGIEALGGRWRGRKWPSGEERKREVLYIFAVWGQPRWCYRIQTESSSKWSEISDIQLHIAHHNKEALPEDTQIDQRVTAWESKVWGFFHFSIRAHVHIYGFPFRKGRTGSGLEKRSKVLEISSAS